MSIGAARDPLEKDLETLMEEEFGVGSVRDTDPPRKRLRGSIGSFDELHDMHHREAAIPVPPPPQDIGVSRPLISKVQAYKTWAEHEQGHLLPAHRIIVAMSKFVCELDCTNYMLSNKQKLMLAMLLDGDHWRAHKRQIFHYDNGAWIMKGSLNIVAWDNLLALEGLFIQLALKLQDENASMTWSWEEAKHYILDIVADGVEGNGDLIGALVKVAKDNSDHLRASTANKTWQAHWTRRCADMMAQLRRSWEDDKPKHIISKLFLSEWDTPMPQSRGICFDDVYINQAWQVTNKSPEANCKCTGKMIFEIGRGGDGKGMEAVLDTALFGNEASATLDCGVTSSSHFSAVFLRDWCILFFEDNPIQDCLDLINNLEGNVLDMVSESNERVLEVHEATPWKRVIKEYLILKVESLPGHVSSYKGKRTKMSYFVEAVDHAEYLLFKQVQSQCFHKLLIRWPKLRSIMEKLGGTAVFGSWSSWSCPFQLLNDQEKHKHNGQDQLCLGRITVGRYHESVHWTSLCTYAALGTDRCQNILDAYVQKHIDSGHRDTEYSISPVEYYKLPHYGRSLVRRLGGQKLTREARKAAFETHCAEIDVPCCHPRLLVQKLMLYNLWDADKYPMLNLFVENFQAWRKCLAEYMEAPMDVAKTELIRIFYGGKPTVEIPFLLKLCAEVQQAATVLLQHPESMEFSALFADRRNPEFSRLSALLSFEEAKLLTNVSAVVGSQMNMLIFDGAYIKCFSLQAEIQIMLLVDCDEPLSAEVFNAGLLHSSQRTTDAGFRLVHITQDEIVAEQDASITFFAHYSFEEERGHWYGFQFLSADVVSIEGVDAGSKRLEVSANAPPRLLEEDTCSTWFRLDTVSHELPEATGPEYKLQGAAMRSDVHHHYNYRKVDGDKYHSLDLDRMDYICVNSRLGFCRRFLDYHNALQFRGGLSHNAIMFVQGEVMWEEPDQHARWHIDYANAQLYYQVVKEATQMWTPSSHHGHLYGILIEQPLGNKFLDFYRDWWQRKQLTLSEWRAVHEVVIDGHEKVAPKRSGPSPAHAGRPRKDGSTKQRENGWFMAIDPSSGTVLSVSDMSEPENSAVAKNVLGKVLTKATNLNCVIYDKMCVCLKSFTTDKDFKRSSIGLSTDSTRKHILLRVLALLFMSVDLIYASVP
ncbi:unnamed protein product [Symbiodinium sp. CCMP2592]|nr:unnamed protein product [Symbiodinium sp. CCMP2592]